MYVFSENFFIGIIETEGAISWNLFLKFVPLIIISSRDFGKIVNSTIKYLLVLIVISEEIYPFLLTTYVPLEGRIISFLEGGYDLIALSESTNEHLRALKS